jgi:hypothetical protein
MIPENLKHIDIAEILSRHTINFTPRQALIDQVVARAVELGLAPEDLAEKLVEYGVRTFDRIIDTRNPSDVIAEWAGKADAYAGALVPWSYVCQRRHISKVRLTAGEFEVSTSAFTSLLLAEGLEQLNRDKELGVNPQTVINHVLFIGGMKLGWGIHPDTLCVSKARAWARGDCKEEGTLVFMRAFRARYAWTTQNDGMRGGPEYLAMLDKGIADWEETGQAPKDLFLPGWL